MPFILAAITLLGTAVYWYFHLRRVGSAAHDVIDAAERLRGRYRRKRFLGRAESSPIASVDDPAVAAVAMLIGLSRSGQTGTAQEDIVKAEMRDVMGLPNVDEAYISARWVADHADDPNTLSFRFSRLWKTMLSASERADLYAMAGRVTAVGGTPTAEQTASLRLLRDRLGLTQP